MHVMMDPENTTLNSTVKIFQTVGENGSNSPSTVDTIASLCLTDPQQYQADKKQT